MTHRVAVVGVGVPPGEAVAWGPSGRGYVHASEVRDIEGCELVACADVDAERARRFAGAFDLPDDRVFEDYRAMLDAAEPDIVTVGTPPDTHADIVVDCATHPAVAAVHCEKPMANTWGECRRMAEACEREGVQLTFNHQRRTTALSERAHEAIAAGRVGDVRRVEFSRTDLFETGIHIVDLCHWFAGDADVEWVLGNVHYPHENVRKGVPNEVQATASWRYANGVHGAAFTGPPGASPHYDSDDMESSTPAHVRVEGTDGALELDHGDGPNLRCRRDGDGWAVIDTPDDHNAGESVLPRVVAELDGGPASGLGAENALRANGLVFGVWESARRRGRVEFPLDIEDNPLAAMVGAGELPP